MGGAAEPEVSRDGPRGRKAAAPSFAKALSRSPASNNIVLRKHQIDRLNNHTGVRLIVAQAPAGFGKTTLLRQYCAWREGQGASIAWLHLEAHYSDPSPFLRLLCEAITGAIPDGEPVVTLSETSSASIQDFLRCVRAVQQDIVIVIDNFEQAAHPGMEAVIAQLVRVLPSGAQL